MQLDTKLIEWICAKGKESAPSIQHKIGQMFHEGQCVPKNIDSALEWYQKASSDPNYTDVHVNLGDLYFDRKEYKLAFASYSIAGSSTDGHLEYNQGELYEFGNGTEKDLTKATEYFKTSSEKGFIKAHKKMGSIYEKGLLEIGLEADVKKSFDYFTKAIPLNDPEVYYKLGDMYSNGTGTPEDEKTGLEWFKKAAELGHTESEFQIGRNFNNERQYTMALNYFLKAAEKGHAEGQYYVANMYHDGNGAEKNITTALEWATKSANQRCVKAYVLLGYIYDMEFKDFKNAYEWYSKAANENNGFAHYNLGIAYQYGEKGLEKDIKKAFECYKKSAKLECVHAITKLGQLYRDGEGTEKNLFKSFKYFVESYSNGNEDGKIKLKSLISNNLDDICELFKELANKAKTRRKEINELKILAPIEGGPEYVAALKRYEDHKKLLEKN